MSDDRVRRLEAARLEEAKRYNRLVNVANPTPETLAAREESFARLIELAEELVEARGGSLTGEGTPRL